MSFLLEQLEMIGDGNLVEVHTEDVNTLTMTPTLKQVDWRLFVLPMLSGKHEAVCVIWCGDEEWQQYEIVDVEDGGYGSLRELLDEEAFDDAYHTVENPDCVCLEWIAAFGDVDTMRVVRLSEFDCSYGERVKLEVADSLCLRLMVGDVVLLNIGVEPRKRFNATRRTRLDKAVYMFSCGKEWQIMSLSCAIQRLRNMGLDPQLLLNRAVEQGWEDEVTELGLDK
jgi:hypothetical protein